MSRKKFFPSAVLFLGLFGLPLPGGAQAVVEQWDRWEKELLTTRNYHLNDNPYRKLILRVSYTPVSCANPSGPWCQPFTGYGFWDGDRSFKVRAAFPQGTWNWSVTCSGVSGGQDCSTDPALDSVLGNGQTTTTATGQISVVNDRFDGTSPGDPGAVFSPRYDLFERGFVLPFTATMAGYQRYLAYGDGMKRFFWQADTAWGAAITDINNNTRWLQFLGDRATRKFSVVMMAPAPSSDNAATATGTLFEDVTANGDACNGNAWPKSCSHWRPAYWRTLDEKIRLANDKGMVVVLIGIMDPQGNASNQPADLKYPRPEDAAIFARNLAARLSGSHVIFSPSFDDPQNTETRTLANWVGCALRDAAPRHLVTAHLGGGSPVSDYQSVHNQRWHQLHVFQSGHGKNTADKQPWEDVYEFSVRRARAIPDILYNTFTSGTAPACPNVPAINLPAPPSWKPAVNGEAAYDHTYTSPTYTQLNSQQVDTPYGVRHTGYYSTLNGSFGFTLGVKGIFDWNLINSTSLGAEGSRHMVILGDQFRLNPWYDLYPRFSWIKGQKTELFSGQAKPEEDKQAVMAATVDYNFVLLYMPHNSEVKFDASALVGFDCNSSTWSKTWINPRTGQSPQTPGICQNITDGSGATRKLIQPSCPSELSGDSGNCDWIVRLQQTSSFSALNSQPSTSLEVWTETSEEGVWQVLGRIQRETDKALSAPIRIAASEFPLRQPIVARQPADVFLVVWEAEFDGHLHGVFSRRVNGQGRLLEHEYPVNRTVDYDQINPWAAASPTGRGVITWTSFVQDGDRGGIFARLVNPAGVPHGPEIAINQHTAGRQDLSKVGTDAQGNFVVAWTSDWQDGDEEGVYARRFDSRGEPLGNEFRVNSVTAGAQFLTSLEVDPLGGFAVTWASYAPTGEGIGIFGRQYSPNGTPLGGEFMIAPLNASLQE